MNRKPLLRWLIPLGAVIITLILLENGMRLWLVQSDSFGHSRMAQRWFARYWNPINSLDYRDGERLTVAPDVQRILVIGDSFVAGQGINDADDTFPHQLGRLLGTGYTVNIAAQPGWETAEIWDALQTDPLIPDVLILSHYLNDITWTDPALLFQNPLTELAPSVRWLVDNLEIPNFIFWRIAYPSQALDPDFYARFYQDPLLWQKHTDMLQNFITYADSHHAQLIVIIWPLLRERDQLSQPVAGFFQAQNIPVIDMTAVLQEFTDDQIVVSIYDAHPNVLAHKRAAENLYVLID